MVFKLLTFSALLLGTSFAIAFEGTVSRVGANTFLVRTGQPQLKIEALSEQVATQLNTLEDGDYLSATGEINENLATAFVETVDFVGIRRILGQWVSPSGLRIHFKDYKQAQVEENQPLPWDPNEKKAVDLVYALLPLKELNWSLFMSNRKTVRVGTLKLQERSLTIQLVDQKTGQITEDISLSPVTDPQ